MKAIEFRLQDGNVLQLNAFGYRTKIFKSGSLIKSQKIILKALKCSV